MNRFYTIARAAGVHVHRSWSAKKRLHASFMTTPASIVYADFKNAEYKLNGSTTAITSLFEEFTSAGTWDPNMVLPGIGIRFNDALGYRGPSLKPAVIGTHTPVADGFCYIIESFYTPNPDDSHLFIEFTNEDDDESVAWNITPNSDGSGEVISPTGAIEDVAGHRSRLAVNILGTSAMWSVNGGNIRTNTLTTTQRDTITRYTATTNDSHASLDIEKIELYPAVSPVSLQLLSAL